MLLGPRDDCLASGWLTARDLWEFTSERLESDWDTLLPEGGAWDESLEGPCKEEERHFCSLSSLFSSSPSFPLSLSVGAFMSFLCCDGESEEEEEELEDDDEEEEEEEENLPGWGTSFGNRCSFSLSLSCCTSLPLVLSCCLSLDKERPFLLRCRREGERWDLRKKILNS